MAFQHHKFGQEIATSPAKAHAKLGALFKLCDFSVARVAEKLGASRVQLYRWMKKLEASGFADPRGEERAARGQDQRPKGQPRVGSTADGRKSKRRVSV